ncbi:MAG: efflux RND transporter periplasmic adaptor subunit [Woeseia sp.]
MKRSFILPLIALLGVVVATVVIIDDNRPTAILNPAIQPAESPYPSHIAGAGIIETALGNTVLGAPVPGVVTEIYVTVGEHVKAGQPLFKIDDRDLQARLVSITAQVTAAEAEVQLPKHQLARAEQLARDDPDAISIRELSDLQDEAARAEASLELARAQVRQLRMDIDRRTVRAPAAGQVLKIGIRRGEYLDSSIAVTPAILFGQNDKLYVRVDIDENEEWRLQSGAEAVAFVRSNRELRIPLQFEYIEPYVTTKIALTGQGTERTDRRVLQVIYRFDPDDLPVHVGQQVDVFIQAPPVRPRPESKDE